MGDEVNNERQAAEDESSAPVLLASPEDLTSIDLAKALAGLDHADDLALERALNNAAKSADEVGDAAGARGYRLLALLCTLHLRVDDPAEPWGPRFVGPEGRSYTASDFRGEQNAVLAGIIDGIAHPALRARIADVVWYNDRKQGGAAAAAIAAYSETIERRLDGTYNRGIDCGQHGWRPTRAHSTVTPATSGGR